ncbi:hypothetical protein [Psychrobacillus sp. L3]|uniref:hypothetical protein n=1 Tax=Psychrobacillus sp. L3 TaxID=3236891 RepID=UPI0036F38B02
MKLKKGLLNASLDGIISGILLTIFFKSVEYLTTYKVYTLLLNVDYIPFLNQYKLTEIVEVILHLIVSVALSMCLYILVHYMKMTSQRKIILIYIFVCFIFGILIFPTTALSTRTPSITSIPSLTYWLAGHLLYGYTLGFSITRRLIALFSSNQK